MALVFLASMIPYLIGVGVTPESPQWLLYKGREYSASVNLEWFKGRIQSSATTDQKLGTLRGKIDHERAVHRFILFGAFKSYKSHIAAFKLGGLDMIF